MQLTDIEVRILGSLAEKEATTPDAYPLTLNALTNACNQTSNRDPVMELGEDAVRWAINNLRQHSLVRAIQRSDSRVMKYQHLLMETLQLEGPALAVMCVLMLRGPQTTGEIRGRMGRLADFASLEDVESTVAALVGRELVVELPRRAGQKEPRFAHLLSGPIAAPQTEDRPAVSTSQHDLARAVDVRDERITSLETVVEELRRELAELRARFDEFSAQFK